MTILEIKVFLLWSVGINYGILLLWFGVFFLAHDWLFWLHTRWFRLSAENFDTLNYAGMAVYKIGIMLFNLVPLIALTIIGH
ncbi:MAG: DUF6868 family protein [Holophaga sp.]